MQDNKTMRFTNADIELMNQETVYDGYFKIIRYQLRHRLFNGGWSPIIQREVFERGHAVAVLLFDPILDSLVFIEQFRIGTLGQTNNPWLIELVAGIIEEHEALRAVAIRETQEETGLAILDLIPITEYWVSPGGTSEKVSLFCGRVDASQAGGIHGLASEAEDIRVSVLARTEAYHLLETGKIVNAATLIALQWFKLHEIQVRAQWSN